MGLYRAKSAEYLYQPIGQGEKNRPLVKIQNIEFVTVMENVTVFSQVLDFLMEQYSWVGIEEKLDFICNSLEMVVLLSSTCLMDDYKRAYSLMENVPFLVK